MSVATVGADETPSDKLARLKRELAGERALSRVVYDDAPEGIAILAADGSSRINPRAEVLLNTSSQQDDAWKEQWAFRTLDGQVVAVENLPGLRAMRGESVRDQELRVGNPDAGEALVAMSSSPLPNHGSITTIRDIAGRVKLQAEVVRRAEDIAKRDEENRALVERLRAAIDEIATPILRVAEGVLVVPIIGVLDPTRSVRTAERVLAEVSRSRASTLIIEVTGAELSDTATADAFARITRSVTLLGARCVLSGMRPSVARTLVEIGVRLDKLPTFPSLRHALQASLRAGTHRIENERAR